MWCPQIIQIQKIWKSGWIWTGSDWPLTSVRLQKICASTILGGFASQQFRLHNHFIGCPMIFLVALPVSAIKLLWLFDAIPSTRSPTDFVGLHLIELDSIWIPIWSCPPKCPFWLDRTQKNESNDSTNTSHWKIFWEEFYIKMMVYISSTTTNILQQL